MRLADLLASLSIPAPPPSNPEITSVVADSRRVTEGALFVAIRGEKSDGAAHAAEAARRGAAAVLCDRPAPEGFALPWIVFPDPRLAASILSSRVLGDPWREMTLAAVTGTNGKTTTATLLEAVFARAYGRSGFLGTVGYRWTGRALPASRTTPEGDEIARYLAAMREDGVRACAMEVSSHALAMSRVAALRFDAAVFTNLTRDHLDFHGDMESYARVKRGLFDLRKEAGAAVLNADDAYGRRWLSEVAPPALSYSPSGDSPADYRAEKISATVEGTRFTLSGRGERIRIESPILGRFNVENLLAAGVAARSLGIAPATIEGALAASPGAPGRMERVEAGQPFPILVDYAHTEDALRRLLKAVRELTDRTLVLVFGCGGDRDRGKREPMGRVAAELADIPIATSDNPRSEDPEAILREVERGLVAGGATKYLKLADRREAIARAMELANSRSIVVIAGKGHETEQVIGDRIEPFDDRRVASELASRARRPVSP